MARSDILIGYSVADGDRPVHMPSDAIFRRHAIALGRTRSGKTASCLGLLLQAIRLGKINVLILDLKGELADQFLDFSAVLGLTDPAFAADRFNVFSAFSGLGIGLNPLLLPDMEPGVLAHNVASLMADLAPGAGVGIRMAGIVGGLVRAVAPLRGSLLDCRRILQDEAFRLQLAAHVKDPETQLYIRDVLPKEPAASREAVRGRIDFLLGHEGLRQMLLADHCQAGSVFLESPVTVLSVGGAPLGLPALTRFVGGLLFTILVGAVFTRPVGPDVKPCVILVDEWQEAVRLFSGDIDRTLSLAAFKKIALFLTNQTMAQIEAVSHALVSSVVTNVGTEYLFAPSPEDLRHVELLLPVTGHALDPSRPDRCLSEAHELQDLKRRLSRLAPRTALFVDRVGGTAQVIRTPTLPYERVIAEVAKLPPGVRAAYARGRLAMPLPDLTGARIQVPDASIPDGAASGPPKPRVARRGVFRLPT